MLPPSPSARLLYSVAPSLLPIKYRTALSRILKSRNACLSRFLYTEFTDAAQKDSGQQALTDDRPVALPTEETRGCTLEERTSSGGHFSTIRKVRALESPPRLVRSQMPEAHVLIDELKKSPHKATVLSSTPGKSKKARRKLLKELKVLSELLRDSKANTDKTLTTESWGDDALKPSSSEGKFSTHASSRLPSYSRRIEGLLGHSDEGALEEIEPPTGRAPIATLAHGLDRVLFNPGVHWVQDPRSRVYNFTPFIQTVPDIKDFAFDRLSPFVRSSRDRVMRDLATARGKRFAGSTSSLSGLLCHIYFLLSQGRKVNVSALPEPFSTERRNFTPAQRMPTAVAFNHRDGVYMIDSDSTDNDDSQWNVLMWMGTMLENFFTLPKSEFLKLLRSSSPENSFDIQPQAYRYSQSNLFVMRSQLDCVDPRLPGSGVFDIKTRAALPLRMDNLNFKENSGYVIKSLHGDLNSFDKEYYDLIRSAFLKYSFQARIGNMDGIFLAYHNTARVFGFQYVPLEEMDSCLFGDYKYKKKSGDDESSEIGGKEIGWRIFNKCIGMLEVIASEISECFPGQSVTCLAETNSGAGIMHVWIQPIDEAAEANNEGEEIPYVTTDSERPIVQLDITAKSYLGGSRATGPDAVFLSRREWTVHWTVSRSSLPEKSIRQHLAAAKKRKSRPKAFPTGVNAENLEEFIKNLGFGNPELMPDAKHFVLPDPGIRFLRRLSRKGQEETERLKLKDEAKGVHVLQPMTMARATSAPLDNDTQKPPVEQSDIPQTSDVDIERSAPENQTVQQEPSSTTDFKNSNND